MEDLPKPIELTKQVWIIPCRISKDFENFIPLTTPSVNSSEAPKKTKWKPDEDEFLKNLATKTKRWSAIAKEINMNYHKNVQVRDGKQCRERWNNHLNPLLNKEKWTVQEDCVIIESWKKFGPKWAQIAKLLQNRTENQVKNRWKSLRGKPEAVNMYPFPVCNFNLNKLETIEPFIQTDLDGVSPIGSFKIDEMKSPLGSMSSVFDVYFSTAQSEQIMNAHKILDSLISNN